MRLFLAVWVLVVSAIQAEEMEVRKYHLSEVEFGMMSRSLEHEELRESEVLVEKPGFESRFFEGEGKWYDCSKWVGLILRDEEFSGVALMDRKRGVMVMRAEEGTHEDFAAMVRAELPRQLRLEAAIYEVPGVVSGMRKVGAMKGAELLGEISLAAIPGQIAQAQTAGGELEVETEVWIDMNDGIAEVRATIGGELREVDFSMMSGFTVPLGMPWLVELGSVAGEKSMVMVVTVEVVLMDGTREDAWVLKEEGGEFLRERRLGGMKNSEFPNQEGEFRKYAVPPTFLTFITTVGDDGDPNPDPFAADPVGGEVRRPNKLPVYRGKHKELKGVGLVYDVETLLKGNGIAFREGDFAVFSKLKGTLYAKLSLINQELLAGITNGGYYYLPRMIRFDFEQVDDDGVILKKLGGLALPGQMATVSLGPDLKVEIEAQIDANDAIVETRFKLAEVGGDLAKPSLGTGVTLRDGIPVVVQTTFSGERKSWKLTANIVAVEDVVERYLERLKR